MINDVSIIIVNYNTRQMTNECIDSIINYTNGLNYEIILVDNGSSDGSKEFFEKKEGIIYIYSDENLGFGRANNIGAEIAKGEFIFFLNSDTLFVEDSLSKLYNFYVLNEKNLKIGVLGAIMVDEKGCINGFGDTFPTILKIRYKLFRKIPFFFNFVKMENKHIYDTSKTYFKVDYVLGADMLIRKALFKKVMGFDPNYFMYYEESDLQLRLAELKYINYILTTTKIIHFEGGSVKTERKKSNFKREVVHSSEIYYVKKNFNFIYNKFKIFDRLWLLINIFNYNYSFKENTDYIKKIWSKY